MGNCGSNEKKPTAAKKQEQAAPLKVVKAGAAEHTRDIIEGLEQATKAVQAEVLMISGCQDAQTSADVSNVDAILKEKSAGAPSGAGGACTSSLLHVTGEDAANRPSWIELLQSMRAFLKEKEYKQVPQLSSTIAHSMSEKFSITGNQQGRKIAMLTGINYEGTQAELSGCANDVCRMVKYIDAHGFKEDPELMKVFLDPPQKPEGSDLSIEPQAPTRENLLAGIKWITETVREGDAVFFHYSGHGTQVPDEDGSEEDGKDEALVPMDYASLSNPRFITDDDIFKYLVSALPNGVRLFALMDCCHSGTIFDLPYTVKADDTLAAGAKINANHEAFAALHGKTVKKGNRQKK